ncbi:flagellar attachment zone protein [Trypanosoma cruzi]|nr:flagellar attachment zone protein [Trypanosoma cruzi]
MVLLLHDDRGSLPVGAVVAYERIEHDNGATWSWALGTIQRRMDDHSCVVRRWDREAWGDDVLSSSTSGSSQPVINVLTNELNRVNIRLKDSQRRLFDVERSIISQRTPRVQHQ